MIHYIKGDVAKPIFDDNWIIAHVCNNMGAFNKGVAKAIREKYPAAYNKYRTSRWKLGTVNYVAISEYRYIANMIAQNGLPSPKNKQPCNLQALACCLVEIDNYIFDGKFGTTTSIHIPRIGTGYGGRDWYTEILPLIESILSEREVYVYDLE